MSIETFKTWVWRPQPVHNPSLRLFCFPFACGGGLTFRTWPDELPMAIETNAIQLPGREGRIQTPPFTRMKPLIEALEEALLPNLDVPFAFFGHSMGAVVAFELARKLRAARGLHPKHLFVSARRAPHLPSSRDPVHNQPTQELVRTLRRMGGTPEQVFNEPELMALFLKIARADFELLETYTFTPGEPLECPISVFHGLQDQEVTEDEAKTWREHTSGAFSQRTLPGGHFFLNTARRPLLRAIAQDLGFV